MTPDIQFHIEELVLHGFSTSDRGAIGAAVQQELMRLLTEQGMPPSLNQGGTIEQLDGGKFQLMVGERGEAIGSQIAQSVYGGLTG